MRWLLTALLPLVLCLGCPGQRRPPPRAEPPDDPRGTSSGPERTPPQATPQVRGGEPASAPQERGPANTASPPGAASPLEGFRVRLQKVEGALGELRAAPERARWERVIETIDALQDRAYGLQDQLPDEEQDALYELLERLAVLRDEAVRLEPAS